MALVEIAQRGEEIPSSVREAYPDDLFDFGPKYIIPKPFDPRVLIWEAAAVAEAAMRTGVAQKQIDLDEYREELKERLDRSREVMRKIHILARRDPKRIVFPEGTHPKIVWASSEIAQEGIAKPILLGKKEAILARFEELHHDATGIDEVVGLR